MNGQSVLSAAGAASSSSSTTNYAPPGLIAFLIVCALGVALYFLLKSMGKQLGRAKAHFDAEEAALVGAAGSPDGSAAAAGNVANAANAANGSNAVTMDAVPAQKTEGDAE